MGVREVGVCEAVRMEFMAGGSEGGSDGSDESDGSDGSGGRVEEWEEAVQARMGAVCGWRRCVGGSDVWVEAMGAVGMIDGGWQGELRPKLPRSRRG
jgi:hypothetical protein